MAEELSFWAALPLYVISYGVAAYVVLSVITKAKKLFEKKD